MPMYISTVCDIDTAGINAATHLDQLKRLKVAIRTAACALEGLLDAQACRADTVGYVDDARQFLELPEQLLRDDGVIARPAEQWLLRGMALGASDRRGREGEVTT